MALDVDLGEALHSLIAAAATGFATPPTTTAFAYDDYVESERVDNLTIRMNLGGDMRELTARDRWHRSADIQVVVLAPLGANDPKPSFVALFDFVDELLDFIETAKPSGKRAVGIDPMQEGRYDKEKLHDDRQFRAAFMIRYKLI